MDESQIKNVFLNELASVITAKGLIVDSVIVVIIFLGALGLVYVLGRMFGLVNSIRGRNLIAFLTMIAFTFVYVFVLDKPVPEWVSEGSFLSTIYLSIADISKLVILVLLESLVYVLIGMRLYSRVDKVLDKNIAEDSVEEGQDVFADEYNKKHTSKKK